MEKALLIVKTLYFGYFILFIFDNAISYLVYIKNRLFAYKMNKKPDSK